MVDEKKDIAAFSNFKDNGSSAAQVPQQAQSKEAPKQEPQPIQQQSTPQQSSPGKSSERIFVSPLAKKVAEELNVNLSALSGSGPSGRIIKQDIMDHVSSAKTVSAQKTVVVDQSNETAQFTDLDLSQMRKVIAERLLFSKTTIPHFYISADVEMDNILKFTTFFI